MAKKDKSSVDKIVKKVNKDFDKTSAQLEKLVNDALKQFDSLQHQVQEPIRKLMGDIDQVREREMKRFNKELDKRMREFQELQDSVLERLGVASREGKEKVEEAAQTVQQETERARVQAQAKAKKAEKKVAKAKSKSGGAASAKTAGKAKAKAKANTKPKQSTGKKPPKTAKSTSSASQSSATASVKRQSTPKAAKKPVLTDVNGIGPATAKKLEEAGIKEVSQLANPNAAEQEKLQAFSTKQGFSNWSTDAKKLL